MKSSFQRNTCVTLFDLGQRGSRSLESSSNPPSIGPTFLNCFNHRAISSHSQKLHIAQREGSELGGRERGRAGGESVRLKEGQLEYGKAAYGNVRRNRSKKKIGNLQKEELNFRNFTATLKLQHFTHWLIAVMTILASGKGKLWKASWWLNCSIEMHFSEL